MPDYLDDDVVDMLHEMGRKSLEKERDVRRQNWLKKYPIDITNISSIEFIEAINQRLKNEFKNNNQHKEDFMKNIQEEINWIFLQFNLLSNKFPQKGFSCERGYEKVYLIEDKGKICPIFEITIKEHQKLRDNYRWNVWYADPKVTLLIPDEIIVDNWESYVFYKINKTELLKTHKSIKEVKANLAKLLQQEKFLSKKCNEFKIK